MSDLKRHPQTITAAEAENLLLGVRIEGKPDLDRLAETLSGVRSVATEAPPRELIEAQLAAISELLDRTRTKPAHYALASRVDRTVQATNYALATPSDRTLDRTVKPAKYAFLTWLHDRTMGSVRRRAYALSTAMLIATGSAAAAGVLPDAAQNALADAASNVGISIPHSSDDGSEQSKAPEVKPASESASDVAVAVHVVIESRDQYGNGRDFGQAVAQAARDAAAARREAGQSHAKDGAAGPPSDPGSQGANNSSVGKGNAPDDGREFGQSKARQAGRRAGN